MLGCREQRLELLSRHRYTCTAMAREEVVSGHVPLGTRLPSVPECSVGLTLASWLCGDLAPADWACKPPFASCLFSSLLVRFPGGPRWESNSSLSLLCQPLGPVLLTWVPAAFRRSLKLAGLSSAWQEAGQTELMGCGSVTAYSYHSDTFTLQIRPNASYSPPGKKQIGRGRERLPTAVSWPGEFHGRSPWGRRVRHDWATFTFTFFTGTVVITLGLLCFRTCH